MWLRTKPNGAEHLHLQRSRTEPPNGAAERGRNGPETGPERAGNGAGTGPERGRNGAGTGPPTAARDTLKHPGTPGFGGGPPTERLAEGENFEKVA